MAEFYRLNIHLENDADSTTVVLDESADYWSSTQSDFSIQHARVTDWGQSTNKVWHKTFQNAKVRAIRRF